MSHGREWGVESRPGWGGWTGGKGRVGVSQWWGVTVAEGI